MNRTLLLFAVAATAAWSASTAHGLDILQPGDPVIAIDLDYASGSRSPATGTENVVNLLDGVSSTKYVNQGVTRTGFIVTPGVMGALQSFVITTANDHEERDPISYEVYGTHSSIMSVEHGSGIDEPWTLISSGPISLPVSRHTPGPAIDFANGTAFSSYKVIFPELRNIYNGEAFEAKSMQIADIAFFTEFGGTGTSILTPTDFIIPIRDALIPASNSPESEGPANAIDRNVNTKYVNRGKENSGLIVTPSLGPTIATGIKISTANDWEQRDPMTFEVYGTNEEITTPNNGIGNEQNWTLIAQGALETPLDRYTESDVVTFNNNESYTSYRIIFPTVRDPDSIISMQIAEVQLIADDPASLIINRQTGEVTIRAEQDFAFTGYEIKSLASQGLDDSAWNSIALSGADPNDDWEVTSVPGARDILSEHALATGANDGVTLLAGNSLSLGFLWPASLPTTLEDLTFSLFGTNGQLISENVVYEGNEVLFGDYSNNGVVDLEDWALFRAGLGGNYHGLSPIEAYLGGDLDGDFDSDIYDFNLFLQLAGGSHSLFGPTAVPEPSTVLLVTVALMGGITLRARRQVSPRKVAMLGVLAFVPLSASSAQGQFASLGPPVSATTPDPLINVNWAVSNLFDDDVLDDGQGTQISADLFVTDYNEISTTYAQYGGAGAQPKTVFLDYGAPVTANWFAYAQRSGPDPLAHRVGTFELWFSDTDFNDALPASPADAIVNLAPDDERLRDSTIRPYTLGGDKTGRYVAIRFTMSDFSANQATNNIGGHEFRLMTGPSDVVLEVNRATGEMTLRNNGSNAANVELEAFTIDSSSGGLNADGFTGIGGQSGFPDGTGIGNGWEVGNNSNANRLIETYFNGSSTLTAGTTGLSLGNGYNPLSLAEDITFRWTTHFFHDGEFKIKMFDGVVNYVGIAPDILPGDYNNDGMVDAADYTVWRNSLGTDATLPNDSTPGSVDIDDYGRWKANFGNSAVNVALASSSAPVPEPATALVGVIAAVGLYFGGRTPRPATRGAGIRV